MGSRAHWSVLCRSAGIWHLLCTLVTAGYSQSPTCDGLLKAAVESCSVSSNANTFGENVNEYALQGCIEAFNASQGPVLEVLVSATVRLPTSLLERFQLETGWGVRISYWDEASNTLPALAGSASSSTVSSLRRLLTASTTPTDAVQSSSNSSTSSSTSTSNLLSASPAWAHVSVLSYDAWILDSQLLGGLGSAGALAPPAEQLDPTTYVELQRAAAPEVRLYGTSYQYQAAALPLGANTLVLYANSRALKQLYDNPRMHERLGLSWALAAAAQAGAPPASGVSAGGATTGDSNSADSSVLGDLQLPLVWSWEQLVDAVAAVNGTDFDGDGVREYGMCLEVSPGCLSSALVQAIAATYLQTRGSADGILLDPVSLAWRLDSPGFLAALWTLQRLLSYAPAAGGDAPSCRRLSRGFAEGRCGFTIHTLSHLKASHAWPARETSTVYGTRVMLLPGSTRVDRGLNDGLEHCTSATCPYSLPLSTAVSSTSTDSWSSLLGSFWRSIIGSGGGGSSGGMVNVAPLVYGIPVGAISSQTPAPYRAAAARLMSYLAATAGQTTLASDLESGISSFRHALHASVATTPLRWQHRRQRRRRRQLSSDTPSEMHVLAESDSSGPSTQQIAELAMITQRLWGHPNAAPALRLPGAETTWPLFDAAVAQLQSVAASSAPVPANLPYTDDPPPNPPSPAAVAAATALAGTLPGALSATQPNQTVLRSQYRASLSYKNPILVDPVHQQQTTTVHQSGSGAGVGLIVGLSVGLSAFVLVMWVTWSARSRTRLIGLGRNSSDDDDSSLRRRTATYVVLDIQGVSGPDVPDLVRDHALRMCHDVIKQLARRYNGSLVTLPEQELTSAHRSRRPSGGSWGRQRSGSGSEEGEGEEEVVEAEDGYLEAELVAELATSLGIVEHWRGLSGGGGDGGREGGQGRVAVGEGMTVAGTLAGSPVTAGGGGEGGVGSRESPFWMHNGGFLTTTSNDLDGLPPAPSGCTSVGGSGGGGGGRSGGAEGRPPCLVSGQERRLAAPHGGGGNGGSRTLGAGAGNHHLPGPPSQSAVDDMCPPEAVQSATSLLAAERSSIDPQPPPTLEPIAAAAAHRDPDLPPSCFLLMGGGGGGGGGAGASFSSSSAVAAITAPGARSDARLVAVTGVANGLHSTLPTRPPADLNPDLTIPHPGGAATNGTEPRHSSVRQLTNRPPPSCACTTTAPATTPSATTVPAALPPPLQSVCTASSALDRPDPTDPLPAGHFSELLMPLPVTVTEMVGNLNAAAKLLQPAGGHSATGGPTGPLPPPPLTPASAVCEAAETSSDDHAQQNPLDDRHTLPGQQQEHTYLQQPQQHYPLALPLLQSQPPQGSTTPVLPPARSRDLTRSRAPSMDVPQLLREANSSLGPLQRAQSPSRTPDTAASSPPLEGANPTPAPQPTVFRTRASLSLPTTPYASGGGRSHGVSPSRLRPGRPSTSLNMVTSITGEGTPSHHHNAYHSLPPPLHAARGGGALAVAMAAAKAAAVGPSAPSPPLPTRVALLFYAVHDAVCFCVHMQAMLTTCRWPAEVLELPGCQPIAVRARPVSGDASGAAGEAFAAKGPSDPGGGGGGGSSVRGAGVVCGTESGGGVVLASAHSSFVMVSPSPFSPSGAVDRMKSLISSGVRGRSARLPRPLAVSPRLGSTLGPAAREVERSAHSVSRFALLVGTGAGGLSSGASGAPLYGTQSMAAFSGAGSGYGGIGSRPTGAGTDPWAAGSLGASDPCSPSASTTTGGNNTRPFSVAKHSGARTVSGGRTHGDGGSASNSPVPLRGAPGQRAQSDAVNLGPFHISPHSSQPRDVDAGGISASVPLPRLAVHDGFTFAASAVSRAAQNRVGAGGGSANAARGFDIGDPSSQSQLLRHRVVATAAALGRGGSVAVLAISESEYPGEVGHRTQPVGIAATAGLVCTDAASTTAGVGGVGVGGDSSTLTSESERRTSGYEQGRLPGIVLESIEVEEEEEEGDCAGARVPLSCRSVGAHCLPSTSAMSAETPTVIRALGLPASTHGAPAHRAILGPPGSDANENNTVEVIPGRLSPAVPQVPSFAASPSLYWGPENEGNGGVLGMSRHQPGAPSFSQMNDTFGPSSQSMLTVTQLAMVPPPPPPPPFGATPCLEGAGGGSTAALCRRLSGVISVTGMETPTGMIILGGSGADASERLGTAFTIPTVCGNGDMDDDGPPTSVLRPLNSMGVTATPGNGGGSITAATHSGPPAWIHPPPPHPQPSNPQTHQLHHPYPQPTSAAHYQATPALTLMPPRPHAALVLVPLAAQGDPNPIAIPRAHGSPSGPIAEGLEAAERGSGSLECGRVCGTTVADVTALTPEGTGPISDEHGGSSNGGNRSIGESVSMHCAILNQHLRVPQQQQQLHAVQQTECGVGHGGLHPARSSQEHGATGLLPVPRGRSSAGRSRRIRELPTVSIEAAAAVAPGVAAAGAEPTFMQTRYSTEVASRPQECNPGSQGFTSLAAGNGGGATPSASGGLRMAVSMPVDLQLLNISPAQPSLPTQPPPLSPLQPPTLPVPVPQPAQPPQTQGFPTPEHVGGSSFGRAPPQWLVQQQLQPEAHQEQEEQQQPQLLLELQPPLQKAAAVLSPGKGADGEGNGFICDAAGAQLRAPPCQPRLVPEPGVVRYTMHHSTPLIKIAAPVRGVHLGQGQCGPLSSNLTRLPPLRASATGTQGVGLDDGGGGGGGGGDGYRRRPAGVARRCKEGEWRASGAKTANHMGVRSFGEQVRLTFETLEGPLDRSMLEEGLSVIFRGPRVVCGISTWQYGDDDGDKGGGGMRRAALDGNDMVHLNTTGGGEDTGCGSEAVPRDVGGTDLFLCINKPSPTPPPPPSQQQQAARNLGSPATAANAVAAPWNPGGFGHAYGTESSCAAHSPLDSPQLPCSTEIAAEQTTSSRPTQASIGAAAAAAAAAAGHHGAGLTAQSGATNTGCAGDDSPRSAASQRRLWQRRRLPAPLRRALAICESAQGGFVWLDGTTYSASSQEALQEQCMILHMGDYLLSGLHPSSPQDLYLALDFAHLARLCYLRPPAVARPLSLGLLSAPANAASICFTLVTGMQTLLAWNTEVAKAALGVLRDAALPALLAHGGYLVEDADGLLLTAFPSSRAALAWALECQEEAKHLDWPAELLAHPLGEPVYVDDELAGSSSDEDEGRRSKPGGGGGDCAGTTACVGLEAGSPAAGNEHNAAGGDGSGNGGGESQNGSRPTASKHLVFRGLRFKSGLDCGDVLARVHTTTGRMTYRGRVMNRAARIAGMATAGQVLCSRGLWNDSGLETAPDLGPEALAVGESLGEVQLKGLSAKMEVIHCIRILRSEMIASDAMGDRELDMATNQLRRATTKPYGVPCAVSADSVAAAADGRSDESLAHPRTAAAARDDHRLPVLMQAVPLLSDSESDSLPENMVLCGEDSSEIMPTLGVAAEASIGGIGGAGARILAKLSSKGSKSVGATAVAALRISSLGCGARGDRWSAPNAPEELAGSMGAAEAAPDGSVDGVMASRSRVLPRRSDSRLAYDRSSLIALHTSTNGSAAFAAAVAAARIRRASQVHNNRVLASTGGMTNMERGGAGGGGVGGGSTTAIPSVAVAMGVRSTGNGILLPTSDEDVLAGRLAVEYSSEEEDSRADGRSGSGSSEGGSSPQPRSAMQSGALPAMAALHGMLRRQRPHHSSTLGGVSALPQTSSGVGVGGTAAVGSLATVAAANIKKALRAVRRTILDEPGNGGGNGASSDSGSEGGYADGDGDVVRRTAATFGAAMIAAGGGGGVGGIPQKPRRPPLRGASELIRHKTTTSPGVVASAAGNTTGGGNGGGVRLFDRLRGLTLVRRGGGGGGKSGRVGALDEDWYEPDEDDIAKFRVMPSANSEIVPSRGTSRLLSHTVRARLRGGWPSNAQRSSLTLGSNPGGGGGGGGSGSLMSSFSTRATVGAIAGSSSRLGPTISGRTLGGGTLAGDGVAVGSHSTRRGGSGGHGLVAEMSLASMTMRRHIPVSLLLSGDVGYGQNSFRRAVISNGRDMDDESPAGVLLPPSRPASGSRTAPNAGAAAVGQQPPGGMVAGRGRGLQAANNASRRFIMTSLTYDIQEDGDGNEEGVEAVDEANRASRDLKLLTEREPSAARSSNTTVVSIPSRLASFTSSFLLRGRSRLLQGPTRATQTPTGLTGSGLEGTLSPQTPSHDLLPEIAPRTMRVTAAAGGATPETGVDSNNNNNNNTVAAAPEATRLSSEASHLAHQALHPPPPLARLMMRNQSFPRATRLRGPVAGGGSSIGGPHASAVEQPPQQQRRWTPGGAMSCSFTAHSSAHIDTAAAAAVATVASATPPHGRSAAITYNAHGVEAEPVDGTRRTASCMGPPVLQLLTSPRRGSAAAATAGSAAAAAGGSQGLPHHGCVSVNNSGTFHNATGSSALNLQFTRVSRGPDSSHMMAVETAGGTPTMGAVRHGSGFFNTIHNLLGLAPQQANSRSGGIPGVDAGALSPKGGSPVVSPSGQGQGGTTVADGGAGMAGRAAQRRRRRSQHVTVAGGVEAADAFGASRPRQRSVIEVSGNVMTLNAGSSYTAGGWDMDLEPGFVAAVTGGGGGGGSHGVRFNAAELLADLASSLPLTLGGGVQSSSGGVDSCPSTPGRHQSQHDTAPVPTTPSPLITASAHVGTLGATPTESGEQHPKSPWSHCQASQNGVAGVVGGVAFIPILAGTPSSSPPRPIRSATSLAQQPSSYLRGRMSKAVSGLDELPCLAGSAVNTRTGEPLPGVVPRRQELSADQVSMPPSTTRLTRLVRGLSGLVGGTRSATHTRHASSSQRGVASPPKYLVGFLGGGGGRGGAMLSAAVGDAAPGTNVSVLTGAAVRSPESENGLFCLGTSPPADVLVPVSQGAGQSRPNLGERGRRLVPELARSARELVTRMLTSRSRGDTGSGSEGGGGRGGVWPNEGGDGMSSGTRFVHGNESTGVSDEWERRRRHRGRKRGESQQHGLTGSGSGDGERRGVAVSAGQHEDGDAAV